jgi:hypothetical protein
MILNRAPSLLIGCLLVFGLVEQAPAELIYGVGASIAGHGNNGLLSWDSSTPAALSVADADLNNPINIDTYAGGNANDIYFPTNLGVSYHNIANHGSHSFSSPVLNPGGVYLGFDMNPVTGKAHVVTDLNKNFYFSLGSASPGSLPLFYAAGDPEFGKDPNLVHLAYTNNVPGAVTTQLYGIDSALDILVTTDDTTGAIHTVGPLGVDVTGEGGFDISGRSGIAYAAMIPANSSQSILYTINLATGAATPHGQIGAGMVITDIAVRAVPEPTFLGLLVSALIARCAAGKRRYS